MYKSPIFIAIGFFAILSIFSTSTSFGKYVGYVIGSFLLWFVIWIHIKWCEKQHQKDLEKWYERTRRKG
jgi:hypothetical protein